MALEGTIKDFALPDIFQLIGLQRKTGILSLEEGQEKVTIKFLEGQVVEADTISDSLENRLGTVLVRTGRITREQLEEALEIQSNTLQRLGHILVKRSFISPDELIDALQIQSSQIIYSLFRWREGRYHFTPSSKLDYDQNHSTPMSAETILMEGARMVDEWPLIERRIPSDTLIFRRTTAAEELVATPSAHPGEFELDAEMELDLELESEVPRPENSGIALSPSVRTILTKVDGKRTVREIVEQVALAEFESFHALSELVERKLIERCPETREAVAESAATSAMPRLLGSLVKLAVFGLAAWNVASLPSSGWTPLATVARSPATARMEMLAAMARLERIDRAIQVYFLDAGLVPSNLTILTQMGYLDPQALTAPWGAPFSYQISGGGYQIQVAGPRGNSIPDLVSTRNFSEIQRMLMATEEATE